MSRWVSVAEWIVADIRITVVTLRIEDVRDDVIRLAKSTQLWNVITGVVII